MTTHVRYAGMAGVALALVAGLTQAEEAKQSPGLLKGAVSRGAVFVDDDGCVCLSPLQGDGPRLKVFHGGISSLPIRWHMRHGLFWPITSLPDYGAPPEDRACHAEVLCRYRLTDLLAGRLNDAQSPDLQQIQGSFAPAEPLRDIHILDGNFEYQLQLHYDYLPIAETKVLLFVLTDARGHLESAGKDGDLDGFHVVVSPEEAKTPKWSLTVHSCSNSWDAEKQIWDAPRWKREGAIEVGFTEGFHALGRGDDYYFLTVSGKLFRAPKPDKGADRKMEAVWDDEKRPVVAFITDADADRTFLFCEPEKDGKGVYFEMDAKPDPQPYDASKVPEAKSDDPLPAVRGYAGILLADKKIKDKQ